MQALEEGWPRQGQVAHASMGDFRKREAENCAGVCDQEGKTGERSGTQVRDRGQVSGKGSNNPREVRAGNGQESWRQWTW